MTSVSCGLDSLILGETQILAQVKFAFQQAQTLGFVDNLLSEVFNGAFYTAGKIQAQTKIAAGKVSVGSVAIDFIKQRLGSISEKRFLIIGVGKVTESVLQYLSKEDPRVVFVANRSFTRAQELAGRIGAEAVRFDQLGKFLKPADVIISATASPHFVVKKETLKGRIKPELLIIDLALPRDVEPAVSQLEGVELFCLEDLQTVIRKNKQNKLQAATKAKELIDGACSTLWAELGKSEPEPALWP